MFGSLNNALRGIAIFVRKIWNAARFCEINECRTALSFDPSQVDGIVNKWIIGKLVEAERMMSEAIESYRFNDAAQTVYSFTWGSFCDWYLESIKPILQEDQESQAKLEVRNTAAWVLEKILHLLHPIMPFVTEELWQSTADHRTSSLIRASWPKLSSSLIDPVAEREMDWLIRLVTEIRSIRSEMNIPPKTEVSISF